MTKYGRSSCFVIRMPKENADVAKAFIFNRLNTLFLIFQMLPASIMESISEGYDNLWKELIKPPRSEYSEEDLGPKVQIDIIRSKSRMICAIYEKTSSFRSARAAMWSHLSSIRCLTRYADM